MDDPEIPSFWSHAARFPSAVSLIDEREREWTAGQLLSEVNRISNGLRTLGVVRGDVVATLLPKCAELVGISLAVSQIGAYLLTLNPNQAVPELNHILSDSMPRVL